jgi:hypothetical protein
MLLGGQQGDDLPHVEQGHLGGSDSGHGDNTRSWHLSPSTPNSAFSRAGSIMRMMSQRVVNLTNEPELVEQTIRRKSSIRQARMDAPPSLPAMPEYAHDSIGSKLVDEDSSTSFWRKPKPPHVNPLKGNSWGIFSPENRLRKSLCEFLVHPATEPVIFFLIIIQTVLLAIESSVNEGSRDPKNQWGTPGFDYAFLGLFGIYTAELIARTIVSGFIINPTEYSTLDRSQGLKKGLAAKARELFTPHDETSTRKTVKPANPQMSILRSLTGFQQPDAGGDPAQQQRIRLARRAFLRHSWNRLDFLAVISYWISFTLSHLELESKYNLHVFRMLSCLRILRLLALTNGTSVWHPGTPLLSLAF